MSRAWIVLGLLAFVPGSSLRAEAPDRLVLWPPSLYDIAIPGRLDQELLRLFVETERERPLAQTVALPSFEPGWASRVNFTEPDDGRRTAQCRWLPGFPGSDEEMMPAPQSPVGLGKWIRQVEAPIDPGMSARLERAWATALGATRVPTRLAGPGCDGESLVFSQFSADTMFTAVSKSWSPGEGTVAAQMKQVGLKLCEYARSCDRDRGVHLEALHVATDTLERLLDALP